MTAARASAMADPPLRYGAIAAQTRPDRRAAFAFERLCVQGILAGLDDRPGAS